MPLSIYLSSIFYMYINYLTYILQYKYDHENIPKDIWYNFIFNFKKYKVNYQLSLENFDEIYVGPYFSCLLCTNMFGTR